jgi:hypothetical protein
MSPLPRETDRAVVASRRRFDRLRLLALEAIIEEARERDQVRGQAD